MKKRIRCALIFLLCASSVYGCAGNQDETEEVQPVTQMQMELEVETLEAAEDETETESEAAAAKTEDAEDARVNTIIGSLIDIDMEQITVLSDNGNEIILPITEAELDFSSGFRLGNLVAVDYTGEITETDSLEADITVIRASDSSDVQTLTVSEPRRETEEESESESVSEGESAADEAESDSESVQTETETETETESETATEESTESAEEAQTLIGEIKEITWNSITLLDEEGEELTLSIVNAAIYFTKGMAEGTEVVVSYTGELSGEEQKVISVTGADSLE